MRNITRNVTVTNSDVTEQSRVEKRKEEKIYYGKGGEKLLHMWGRNKPISETVIYKNVSLKKNIRYVLELEGEICSLNLQYPNGILRRYVSEFNKTLNLDIYSENCDCINKQTANLNADGTPRKHKKYIKDWAK